MNGTDIEQRSTCSSRKPTDDIWKKSTRSSATARTSSTPLKPRAICPATLCTRSQRSRRWPIHTTKPPKADLSDLTRNRSSSPPQTSFPSRTF